MKILLTRVLLEVTSMLLGGLNKNDIHWIQSDLKIFNESTVVARAGGGCMRDKSPWLVVCVIHMLLARMMLDGEGRSGREKNQDVKQL